MKRLLCAAAVTVWVAGTLGACASRPPSADSASTQPVTVVAHLDVARTALDRALGLLHTYETTSRQQTGNLDVEVLRQVSNPNHFTVVESWASRDAYNAHISSDAAREFHKQLDPLLGSPHDERLYRDVSGG